MVSDEKPAHPGTNENEAQTDFDASKTGTAGGDAGDAGNWLIKLAKVRDAVVNLLTPFMWASVAGTLLGNLGGINFLIDLLSHFRLQYLVFQAIFLILATTTRRWILSSICLIAVAVNVMAIAPFYSTQNVKAPESAPRIKILQANVNSRNRLFPKLLELVNKHKPDIICVQELSGAWDSFLTEKLQPAGYSYKIVRVREDNFGIGMYSKLKMESSQIVESTGVETKHFPVPGAFATFKIGDQTVSVMTVHPLPPVTEETFASRNEEFAAINAARDSKIKDPFILSGDLNCSPWSYYFNKLTERSKVKNTALGYGLQPTWPTDVLPLRIPIDHVLASKELVTTSYQVLGDCGSDHFPVLVEMALTPAAAADEKPRVPYRH